MKKYICIGLFVFTAMLSRTQSNIYLNEKTETVYKWNGDSFMRIVKFNDNLILIRNSSNLSYYNRQLTNNKTESDVLNGLFNNNLVNRTIYNPTITPYAEWAGAIMGLFFNVDFYNNRLDTQHQLNNYKP